jgi:RNA polymerase sigma-70 factor (ECF subfamily)
VSQSPSSQADKARIGSLIRSARRGSREALGELLESCRQYLWLVAKEELEEGLQAKVGPSDVVQQTFLEAQRDFEKFAGRTRHELLRWLRRLLLHNLMDACRRYTLSQKRQVGREVPIAGPDSSSGPGPVLRYSGPSPSDCAVVQEAESLLTQALAEIPEPYRSVVAMRHQHGLSFEEIAARLDRSAEVVRKIWFRGIQQLRVRVSGHDAGEGSE